MTTADDDPRSAAGRSGEDVAAVEAAGAAVEDHAGNIEAAAGVALDEDAQALAGAADDPEATAADLALAAYGMVLWLAGAAPDDLLSQCKAWLAEGHSGAVARAVTHLAATRGIALPEEYIGLLATLLAAEDEDPNLLSQVRVAEADPAPYYRFRPDAPVAGEDEDLDAIDRAAVDVVERTEGARGMWRVWRSSVDGVPWPPPKRVYLVEVDGESGLIEAAVRVQDALAAAGERDPQVELFPVSAELPTYHRLAMTNGRLLWAATEETPIEVVPVFDEVDEKTGPRFRPDHPKVDDEDERRRLVDYLNAGVALLIATTRMDDLLDERRKGVVPINFRTDGTWIWTDATTYYLREHGLAPHPGLQAHATARGYQMPELDRVALHRALAVLQAPPDEEEAVWTVEPTVTRDVEPEGEAVP